MTPPERTGLVQIAAYRERDNLAELVPRLLEPHPGLAVLVVDDSSPDGTAELLEELASSFPGRLYTLLRPAKAGYGSATIDGFRRAVELGAERLVTMDADLSHDPGQVSDLLAALDEADLVIGSRYVGGYRVLDWSLARLFVSVLANQYVRRILGLPFTDCTSGFRAYRVDFLRRQLDLDLVSSGGYSVLVEILYRLVARGARVVEAPIVFSERRVGQSKMSKRVVLEAIWRPWWLRLRVSRARFRRAGSRPAPPG